MEFFKTELAGSALVLVDVQERLLKLMKPRIWDEKRSHILLMAKMMQVLQRPVLLTEQYPQGLGKTASPVREALEDVHPLIKDTFSCWGQADFRERLRQAEIGTVILTGMETHICVAQTAWDLLRNGYQVIVPADAVLSSSKLKWETGLRQMEQAGVSVSTCESVLFHFLGSRMHPEFGTLISLLKNMSAKRN